MWVGLSNIWQKIVSSPAQFFLLLLLAFLLGFVAHAFWEKPLVYAAALPIIAIGNVFFSLLAHSARRIILFFIMMACAALGFWRYDTAWRASAYAQPQVVMPREERFSGVIITDEQARVENTLLTVSDIKTFSDQNLPGRALLYVHVPQRYKYGERIIWECRLQPVSKTATGWDNYLLLRQVLWTCGVYAAPEIIAQEQENKIFTGLYTLKRRIINSAQSILPEPEASFLLGLLIGVKDGLPENLLVAFRNSGTSHILAVSGYNVAQLINVGVSLLTLILVPRRKSAVVMAGAVIIFACVVGGDASVIRAAIMGCVGILAALYRRQYSGLRALLIAAALMLTIDPLILRHDVGFQLSFAAVCGLHALAPGLLSLFPRDWRNGATRILCETSAATLATIPVVLHVFGRLPAVSLLANLLILPFIPWAMLFGVMAILVRQISFSLAVIPAVITAWIMRLVEFIAATSVQLFPWSLEARIGIMAVFCLYFWLILLGVAFWRRASISA
jgi:competence protein ComEC